MQEQGMRELAAPIVFSARETTKFLDDIGSAIKVFHNEEPNLLLDYPVVYIHAWKGGNGSYDVYIGESNDIVSRTKEHQNKSNEPDQWQSHMPDSTIYVIGHEKFNKSLTMDKEDRLIHYVSSMGMPYINRLHNGRGNPQNRYYTREILDPLFKKIWQNLERKDEKLFRAQEEIENGAFFKASPMIGLTPGQQKIRERIVSLVRKAIAKNESGKLVFVQGEAGSGKTVLTSSTFYDLFNMKIGSGRKVRACLMVNHDEQKDLYSEIARTLGLCDDNGLPAVYKPTQFINKEFSEPIDVSFVDEAHLLLTQGKQSYQGKNQLEDIIKKSRVTVVMFDENQILLATQWWEAALLNGFKELAQAQGNYLELNGQMRIRASEETIRWIDDLTKSGVVGKIPADKKYEIKVFDSPRDLHDAIKEKAKAPASMFSRLIASYDWDYSNSKEPLDGDFWSVKIGDWSLPWNRELLKLKNRSEMRDLNKKAWHEQDHTINEVGSTFTIQGFDLAYAGVILGPSITYRNGRIKINPEASKNAKATQKRTLSDKSTQSFGEILIQHELRVLMTRGVNGLYLYACDDELRRALKEAAAQGAATQEDSLLEWSMVAEDEAPYKR